MGGGARGGLQDRIQRVPIIVTGNDLSTLFAPLVRDGRMAKCAAHAASPCSHVQP